MTAHNLLVTQEGYHNTSQFVGYTRKISWPLTICRLHKKDILNAHNLLVTQEGHHVTANKLPVTQKVNKDRPQCVINMRKANNDCLHHGIRINKKDSNYSNLLAKKGKASTCHTGRSRTMRVGMEVAIVVVFGESNGKVQRQL
jgi:hypothetical protein